LESYLEGNPNWTYLWAQNGFKPWFGLSQFAKPGEKGAFLFNLGAPDVFVGLGRSGRGASLRNGWL